MLAGLAGCQPDKKITDTYTPKEILIGAVLPQSGPFGAVGQSARLGIDYAVAEINKMGGIRGTTIRTIIVDDQGEPTLSAQRVNELIDQGHVMAIIGGLLDSTAFTAAIQSNRKKVLFLITGAGATGLPEIGPYVFRNRISYARNTTMLCEYLFQAENKRNFAVIFPYDDFGANMAEVFQRRTRELGGMLLAKESYAAGSYNFAEAIGIVREAGPQAIFVPCYSSELLGIAQLAYQQGVRGTLAGIESWTDDGKVSRGLEFLDGAVYTTSFYVDSHDNTVSSFVSGYKAKYGATPDRIAAHNADAVRLIAQCLYAGGFTTESLKEEMSRVKDFPGITGKTSFNNGRDAEKQILFLGISGGKIQKLK